MSTTDNRVARLRLMRVVLCERPGTHERIFDAEATVLMRPFQIIESALRGGRSVDRTHHILGRPLQPQINAKTVDRHTPEQLKLAALVEEWVGICSVQTIRAFVDHHENRSLIIAAVMGDPNAASLIIDALRRAQEY